MSNQKVRAILAIGIVSGVFLISAILVLSPSAFGLQDSKEHISMLKEFFGIFSGILGTIIGYYFGKSDA